MYRFLFLETMVAAGSHAVEAQAVSAPHNRCFVIAPNQVQLPDPIYQYPFLQLAETTLAANLSGMAICFLDLCNEYAITKSSRTHGAGSRAAGVLRYSHCLLADPPARRRPSRRGTFCR